MTNDEVAWNVWDLWTFLGYYARGFIADALRADLFVTQSMLRFQIETERFIERRPIDGLRR